MSLIQLSSVGYMHPEDLTHVWVCYECQQCFDFEIDKDDHTRNTGHDELRRYEITEVLGGFNETGMQQSPFRQDENPR